METGHPSTRAVNSGSGNRVLMWVFVSVNCTVSSTLNVLICSIQPTRMTTVWRSLTSSLHILTVYRVFVAAGATYDSLNLSDLHYMTDQIRYMRQMQLWWSHCEKDECELIRCDESFQALKCRIKVQQLAVQQLWQKWLQQMKVLVWNSGWTDLCILIVAEEEILMTGSVVCYHF